MCICAHTVSCVCITSPPTDANVELHGIVKAAMRIECNIHFKPRLALAEFDQRNLCAQLDVLSEHGECTVRDKGLLWLCPAQ